MGKLLLLSVLFAMLVLPARAAREKNSRKGLKKALLYVVAYNLFYLFILRFIYGKV